MMKEVIVLSMSIEVRLPRLFDEMESSDWGVVELWHIQEQDIIHSDDALLDVGISRGVVTIPTPPLDSPCRVTRICQSPGTTVHIDDLLVVLEPIEET